MIKDGVIGRYDFDRVLWLNSDSSFRLFKDDGDVICLLSMDFPYDVARVDWKLPLMVSASAVTRVILNLFTSVGISAVGGPLYPGGIKG